MTGPEVGQANAVPGLGSDAEGVKATMRGIRRTHGSAIFVAGTRSVAASQKIGPLSIVLGKSRKNDYHRSRQDSRSAESAVMRIVLRKSKVASARVFGETLKRATIDDSHNLSRATEVAYEFSVRR